MRARGEEGGTESIEVPCLMVGIFNERSGPAIIGSMVG